MKIKWITEMNSMHTLKKRCVFANCGVAITTRRQRYFQYHDTQYRSRYSGIDRDIQYRDIQYHDIQYRDIQYHDILGDVATTSQGFGMATTPRYHDNDCAPTGGV